MIGGRMIGGHSRPPHATGVLTSGGHVYGRSITWRADGYTIVVYTVMVRTGQRLLSAAELTRIADGLRS